jgi:hypothetical protein
MTGGYRSLTLSYLSLATTLHQSSEHQKEGGRRLLGTR